METFALRHVSFSYPHETRRALDDVSLTVERGAFLVICGPSGCGKSTLLRHLKPTLSPYGTGEGEVLFEGQALETLSKRRQAQEIGFVLQSPEDQLVTDKVWHELAFGLESLGYDTPTIRRRVAEMAAYFGIQGWFHRDVSQLSGGQKQLLNLAAVMTMQPKVLILDEPTSQLDPIAASEFFGTLGRINRDLGTTVILTEHRLEEVFPLASQAVVMDAGRILYAGKPREVGQLLRRSEHSMFLAMPTAMRLWAAAPGVGEEECPITVREGREWLERFARRRPLGQLPPEEERRYPREPAIQAKELWFRYERDMPFVVKGMSLVVQRGEFMALLGGNAAGKTTALKLLSGLLRPERGEVRVWGTVGLLPQSPQVLFVKETLREELLEPGGEARLERMVELCGLEGLLERHPYDLSGGERQRAALAKLLLQEPDILLLDEPTKGLDAQYKRQLGELLSSLMERGITIVMVSHDIEFCAQYAHHCALFFDGGVVNAATPRTFFSGNSFYTTAANRIARDLLPQAVTAQELIAACGGTTPPQTKPPRLPHDVPPPPKPAPPAAAETPKGLPWWRRLLALGCALLALSVFLQLAGLIDLNALMAAAGITNGARRQLLLYGLFAGALVALGLSLWRGDAPGIPSQQTAGKRGGRSKRADLAILCCVALIPLTMFLGERYLGGRKYYFISLLVLLECMLPFFLSFEGRKPKARELVLVAALCAMGVAGRMVFAMLPEFKPVAALVIVAGASMGGETGFLVGAITMLVSNMLFQQGPWTPWQMFAMGLVGLGAGVLSRRGLLRRRVGLCVFGALATLLLYGGIMNLQSALTWSHDLNAGVFLSYSLTGLPMDCIHAAATWVFLWFGGEDMLKKLERIKTKYALVE